MKVDRERLQRYLVEILSNVRDIEDLFDQSLTHFIGSIEGKFLRIIGRREKKSKVLVISAFFDRRLSRGRK